MKVFVSGRDGIGWALDVQRRCLIDSLERLDHRLTGNPLLCDLIITVHWTPLAIAKRYQIFRFKKTLVLATNFIDLDDPAYVLKRDFERVRPLASAWIAPSLRQMDCFARHDVRSFYQPFYVEDVFFASTRRDKRSICHDLGIDYGQIEGKIVITSIQRDTEGRDLETPKWQKGPELLLDLVGSLPDRSKFVLLLSGPRRHYVLNRCRTEGIPYVYVGKEPAQGEDDVLTNLLPAEQVPDLYQLADIYLVTSKSEGGPKAILEAALTRTFVLSTDVGLAPDFLSPECVFRDSAEYAKALHGAVERFHDTRIANLIERHYRTALATLNHSNMDTLLQHAIDGVTRE